MRSSAVLSGALAWSIRPSNRIGLHVDQAAGAVVQLLREHVRVPGAEGMDDAAGAPARRRPAPRRRGCSATPRRAGARRGRRRSRGSGGRARPSCRSCGHSRSWRHDHGDERGVRPGVVVQAQAQGAVERRRVGDPHGERPVRRRRAAPRGAVRSGVGSSSRRPPRATGTAAGPVAAHATPRGRPWSRARARPRRRSPGRPRRRRPAASSTSGAKPAISVTGRGASWRRTWRSSRSPKRRRAAAAEAGRRGRGPRAPGAPPQAARGRSRTRRPRRPAGTRGRRGSAAPRGPAARGRPRRSRRRGSRPSRRTGPPRGRSPRRPRPTPRARRSSPRRGAQALRLRPLRRARS